MFNKNGSVYSPSSAPARKLRQPRARVWNNSDAGPRESTEKVRRFL